MKYFSPLKEHDTYYHSYKNLHTKKKIPILSFLTPNLGINNVVGYRQPFLQTAGDRTYQVLHDNKFAYDSSMPSKLGDGFWPFTMDHKIPHCIIKPCPESEYYIKQ